MTWMLGQTSNTFDSRFMLRGYPAAVPHSAHRNLLAGRPSTHPSKDRSWSSLTTSQWLALDVSSPVCGLHRACPDLCYSSLGPGDGILGVFYRIRTLVAIDNAPCWVALLALLWELTLLASEKQAGATTYTFHFLAVMLSIPCKIELAMLQTALGKVFCVQRLAWDRLRSILLVHFEDCWYDFIFFCHILISHGVTSCLKQNLESVTQASFRFIYPKGVFIMTMHLHYGCWPNENLGTSCIKHMQSSSTW